MSLNKKIIHYGVGPLGSALISLITLPLIAWLYSVTDLAKFAIFQAIIILYTLMFSFGLDQSFIREYFDSTNKEKLLKNIIIGVLLPSIIFISIVIVFFGEIASTLLYDEYSFSLVFLTFLSCFFSLALRILSSIQRVKDQAILFSLSQLIPKFVFLILVVSFTYLFPINFKNILWAQFLSLFSVFLAFVFINLKYLLAAFKEALNLDALKEYYIYGYPLIFTGIIIWGLKISDRFYLKFLSNLEQLGLYSMAVSIAGAVAIFSSVFNTIWAPLVYKWVQGDDVKDIAISRKVENIAFKAAIAMLCIVILSVLGSRLVVYFLPETYSKIYIILPLCILSLLLYTLSEITSIGINLMKKTQYTLLSCFFAIVVHIGLSFLLIPKLGAVGAAIASGISFYIFLIIRSSFSNNIWIKLNFKKVYFISFLGLVFSFLPIVLQ